MSVIRLYQKLGQTEVSESVEGIDAEGCGGHQPSENQLDYRITNYLKSNATHVRDLEPKDDEFYSSSSWRKGKMEIRVTYKHNNDSDWPCSYPQREELSVLVFGKEVDKKFVKKLGRIVNGQVVLSIS